MESNRTDEELVDLIKQHELQMYKEINKVLREEYQRFLKNVHIIMRNHGRLG